MLLLTWLFFDQYAADTTTGGDGILFDSSLGRNTVSAFFTNSWAAASGLSPTGAVVNSSAAGIHISGGEGIYFNTGRIRDNAGTGVLIDSANASDISFSNSHIYGNNIAKGVDAHGIYVVAAAANLDFIGNRIGNISGGNQVYGIKLGATGANDFLVVGNDLSNNATGGLSNSSTGIHVILGNVSSGSDVFAPDNQIYGNFNIWNSGGTQNILQIDNRGLGTVTGGYGYSNAAGTRRTIFSSGTAPTISSGFNTGSMRQANGTASFTITVGNGTAGSVGTLALPSASHGWTCQLNNQTRADLIQQTANTTASAAFTNYGTTFAATNWTNGDVLTGSCTAN